jgi:hypothetical protein
MKKCCGNCKQFERQSGQTYDLCGAWGNPTHADRASCDFWMMKSTRQDKQAILEEMPDNQ